MSGEVAVRRGDLVVVSCGGVGYRLAVSAETLRHVPRVGEPTPCTAHLIVRDDALLLYGFAAEEERDLFLLLLGVQGVGPKMALAVLSGGPPRELLTAVAGRGHRRLQAVPGIGKRTAERIMVELREKVGADEQRRPHRHHARGRPAHARPRRADRARVLPPGGGGAAGRRAR